MMITIKHQTNSWFGALTFLIDNIDRAEKGHSGFFFKDVQIEQFDLYEDPFSTCCYVNKRGKLTTLRKQYLNQESLDKIFSDDVVEVSMVGGPKWGSTAGNKHCMKSLIVDHKKKLVIINFRNSDFLKKFLVDIYFVEEILKEVGVVGYSYSCHFDNLTLRVPFVYLFLNSVYNGQGDAHVRKYLDSDNKLIQAFLDCYRQQKNKVITYKSLERAGRRMKELDLYKKVLKEYIE